MRLWDFMTQLACSGFRINIFKSICVAITVSSSSFSDFWTWLKYHSWNFPFNISLNLFQTKSISWSYRSFQPPSPTNIYTKLRPHEPVKNWLTTKIVPHKFKWFHSTWIAVRLPKNFSPMTPFAKGPFTRQVCSYRVHLPLFYAWTIYYGLSIIGACVKDNRFLVYYKGNSDLQNTKNAEGAVIQVLSSYILFSEIKATSFEQYYCNL